MLAFADWGVPEDEVRLGPDLPKVACGWKADVGAPRRL